MAQNASFGNQGKKPGWKKVKGPVFGEEWEWEDQTSCVSNVYMYFTLIGTHRYLQINVFIEIRGVFCFLYIRSLIKKCKYPPNLTL